MKPKLFVGSSREALNYANAVQENLHHEAEVTVWNQGVFNLSQTNLESLLEALDQMDYGVFVFASDDIIQIRGEENTITRDNVVMELGLYIGRLGRERSFFFLPSDHEDIRLPTDLIGVSPGVYESNRSDGNFVAATAVACNRVKRQIIELEPASQGNAAPSAPQRKESLSRERSEVGKETDEAVRNDEKVESPGWLDAFADGNYRKAAKLLEEEIEATDKEEDTYISQVLLGNIAAQFDFRRGVDLLEKMIDGRPERSEGYMWLAITYGEAGLYEESLSVVEKGLLAADDKRSLLLRKATILNQLNNREEAKAALEGLLDNHPGHVGAIHELGRVCKTLMRARC